MNIPERILRNVNIKQDNYMPPEIPILADYVMEICGQCNEDLWTR